MTHPFASLEQFRQQFNQGLHELLSKQQLGTFILCLANATNDAELFEQLKDDLKKQYLQLLNQYQSALKNGDQIDVVEEDLLVFLKLHTLGFDNVKLTQQRAESPWQYQFNQLRSFRPTRMTKFQHNGKMFTPYVDSHFHFNKPFMAKECFWKGKYNGKQLDLFYNKYPFADLHGLIVPERESCLPQFLSQDMHQYTWQLTNSLSKTLSGVGLGYNSYGAYASVNHLHFQMFVHSKGLPVSHPQWKHNGGVENYPLDVIKFDDVLQAWEFIDELHNKNQAYNLLYMPGLIYVIPRKIQGSVDVPHWSSGFTWYELSGAMLSFNRDDYQGLSSEDVFSLINRLSL